jgi:hypothetical protein
MVIVMSNKQSSDAIDHRSHDVGAADEQINVAAAERTLAELEIRRERLIERRHEIERERGQLAYAAHTGDAGASKLLDRVITEAVRNDEHLKALADAIAEGQRRLAVAREHEAKAADREAASELRGVLAEFLRTAHQLDTALAAVAAEGYKLHELQERMHRLGAAVPNGAQIDSLGYRSLLTACASTPWRRHFETLAPHERRSFSQLCAIWGQTIERNVATRLGVEQTNNKQQTEAASCAPT